MVERCSLSESQQFLLVFMKLRQNFPFLDLAKRFNISKMTVSRYSSVIMNLDKTTHINTRFENVSGYLIDGLTFCTCDLQKCQCF